MEREVFLRFIERAGLPIDPASVESRKPPEPDLLCMHKQEGQVAFELAELCDPNLASTMNQWNPPEAQTFWTSDPSVRVVSKKLNRTYSTAATVELLCHVQGRIITPDDVIIPTLLHEVDFAAQTIFRRVWFMGEVSTEVLYAAR